MKKIYLFLPATLMMLACSIQLFAADGALSGRFTVDFNGNQVVFSQGNLQYNALVGEHFFDYLPSRRT